jgi:rubrerythrin
LPKIIVTIPNDLEDRVRTFTHRRGDLSRIAVEAIERYVIELEKQRLKALKAAQKNIGEYYKERKFGNLVTARARFTLDGADVQLVVNDLMREQKTDDLVIQEERDARRDHEYLGEIAMEYRGKRAFYTLVKEKIDEIREWAAKELKENGANGNRVRMAFDPDESLRICAVCGYPAEEFNQCLQCGATC